MIDSSNPSRRVIVAQLQNGDRMPVQDADEVRDTGAFNIEAIHFARNGSISVQYNYDQAVESTTAGQVLSFDLTEDYDD